MEQKKIYSWLLSQDSGVYTIDEMMHDHMTSNEKHSFDWYCWNVTSLFKCSTIINLPTSYIQRSTGIVFQNPHYESFIGEYEVESKYISVWRNMTLIDKRGTQLLRKTPPNIMNELLVLQNDTPVPDILIPDGEEYIYDSIESLPKLELDPDGLNILFLGNQLQIFDDYGNVTPIRTNKRVCKLPTFCLHAYVITRSGARKLYDTLLMHPDGIYAIDLMLFDYMRGVLYSADCGCPFNWYCWNVASYFPCKKLEKAEVPLLYRVRNNGMVFRDHQYTSCIV